MSGPKLPQAVDCVVIGAGALGAAIAWQLAAHGVSDLVVIEKSAATHGSTWHAAGLVGQYRSREDLTRLMQASVALYEEIQAETPVDWRPVGSLRLASSPARLLEYQQALPIARRYGVDFHLVSAAEAHQRFPLISTERVEGAAFVPGDGYIDPSALTLAYVARARRLGVPFFEDTAVTAIAAEPGGYLLTTTRGAIRCRRLVVAAGVWARVIGRMLGQSWPVAALEHQYAVTVKHPSIGRDLPALRDPDADFYAKPDVGALAIGGWERATVSVNGSAMPLSFGRELLPESLERIAPLIEAAGRRMPLVAELGLRTIINGPIPVSPDGEPLLGPAPGLPGVWLAIGFTSGIAASGGAGRVLAEWITTGRPPFAVPSLDPARFGPAPIGDDELHARAIAAYAGYYALSLQS